MTSSFGNSSKGNYKRRFIASFPPCQPGVYFSSTNWRGSCAATSGATVAAVVENQVSFHSFSAAGLQLLWRILSANSAAPAELGVVVGDADDVESSVKSTEALVESTSKSTTALVESTSKSTTVVEEISFENLPGVAASLNIHTGVSSSKSSPKHGPAPSTCWQHAIADLRQLHTKA